MLGCFAGLYRHAAAQGYRMFNQSLAGWLPGNGECRPADIPAETMPIPSWPCIGWYRKMARPVVGVRVDPAETAATQVMNVMWVGPRRAPRQDVTPLKPAKGSRAQARPRGNGFEGGGVEPHSQM